MNKSDLITEIAEKCNIYQKDSKEIIDAVFDILAEKLIKGEKVVMSGFGSWYVVKRKEKICRNPQTGEKVFVPEKNAIKFNPSQYISDNLNE